MAGRIGRSTRVRSLWYGTSLYNQGVMSSYEEIFKFSGNTRGKFRLKVIEHFESHGLGSCMDAYGVSKATIYRWKQLYDRSGKELSSLIPKSRAPVNKRKMMAQREVINFIRDLRRDHYRLGKEKIKPFLDKHCEEKGLKTISISTIGKILKRYDLVHPKNGRVYHNPSSKWAKRKVSYRDRVKKSPRIKEPGYIQIDTMHRFIEGIKTYIFNALDLYTRFQFSYAYRSSKSSDALDFLHKFQQVYPFKGGIKKVQTDNGSEFLGEFDNYLKKKKIKHLFIYPRCPKINSFVERANRTLNEEFLIPYPFYDDRDIDRFNKDLMEHLIWFNTIRPHKALGNISPIDYVLKLKPESHMYVTYT
ncbi:MAG: DDE-type integrase/transposase/recombinase, partial [Candidatus Aminicenantes bacterium]|nr:DDE-type integrase/transposase/recombinase [Candidatus Aminicenantes bacterium]